MSDYLDKIQTQKKDGTPLATVPFRDSAAREDITTIQNELTTDTTTVEGNPLNFTTLSAQKSKSTIIDIEPIQDLHGYDKPWVGGAGKNLLPMTVDYLKSINTGGTWSGTTYTHQGITYVLLTDNDNNVIGIKVSRISSSESGPRFYLYRSNTNDFGGYILSGCPTNGSYNTYSILAQQSESPWRELGRDLGSGVTIETGTYKVQIFIGIATDYSPSNQMWYPMIRLSTETDATFQPYTNIASISGRSEIGILGCEKNLLNITPNNVSLGQNYTMVEQENNYTLTSTGGYSRLGFYINGLKIGNRYIVSMNIQKTVTSGATTILAYTWGEVGWTNYQYLYIVGTATTLAQDMSVEIVARDTKMFLGFYLTTNNGSGDVIVVKNAMLRLASDIDSTFEPYTKSTDLTINLGQTVYGGQIDVENGVLVVDRKYKLYDGSSDEEWAYSSGWSKTNTNVFFSDIAIEDAYFPFYDVVSITNCNYFEGVSRNRLYEIDTNGVSLSGTTSQGKITIRILKSTVSSLEDFKTWIVNNNIEIVYILKTPITINLTPHTINLLKGVNNISTDGDKITLTYRNGKVATLSDLLDLEKKLTDEEPYGFIEHMSILDPAQRIEYIGKNKNYSPMTINLAGDHLANYNSWYDFPVIKENKPYMIKADGTVDYALDPNDYTKKFDGSASDVANTSYTGGAFAWIPKTYKREFVVGDDRYVYISTKKLSDEYEAIGFIDENGLEHDGAWIPMFYGTEITQDGTVKIMSLATGAPTQNRNTDTQKTYLTNANPDTLFFGGAIVKVLTDIMIMLGKNSDVQAVFGTGNMSGGNGAQYMKDNACIDGGAFYGTTTNNVLNKAFHSLVLLTQNQWQRDPYTLNIQGEYIVSPYYKYDLTGDSYVKTGVFVTPPSSTNWVYPNKSVSVPHWGAEPVGPYSGSTTTGWADGQYTLANQLTDTTVRVVLRFAYCIGGRYGGLCAVSLNYAASTTYWNIGASPLLLSKGAAPQ